MLTIAAIIPMSHLVFVKSERLKKNIEIFSCVLAFGLLSFSLYEARALLLAVLAGLVLVLYATEKFLEKTFNAPEFLAMLFALAAFVATKNKEIVALAFAADMFLYISQKERTNYFRFGFLWLPLISGYIFAPKSEFFDFFLAATILLRVFDWPLKLIEPSEKNEVQKFIGKILISVALWRTAELQTPGFWIGFWMLLPLFFSWGKNERSTLVLTALSLWSLSPQWGVYSLSLWPAYFLKSKWSSFLFLLALSVGAVACSQFSGPPEEMIYIIIAFQALAVARMAVIIFSEKNTQKREVSLGYILLSSLMIAAISYLSPQAPFQIQEKGALFLGMGLLFFAAGIILLTKKKKTFFQTLPGYDFFERGLSKIEKSNFYSIQRTHRTEFMDFKHVGKALNFLNSEAFIVLLMAAVVVVVFWGQL